MPATSRELEFTGERFVPGALGEIVYEHVHRYAFALGFAAGRRVLDAACGEGYGSALLAGVAANVVGVDIDRPTLEHARTQYQAVPNLTYVESSITTLPLPDNSVDLIVSFETVEHVDARDQRTMLAEFHRVLASDGLLILSSPNRIEYSERRGYRNPFHVNELDREELAQLLSERFPATRWYRQRMWLGSTLRAERELDSAEQWEGGAAGVSAAEPRDAMYFVVLAAKRDDALPPRLPSLSLFSDRDESELARHAAQANETNRLDRLAAERLAGLDRQTGHIQHLERLVAERDAEIARRENARALEQADLTHASRLLHLAQEQAAEIQREGDRLQLALSAQERIIAHRQSLRWWLSLPVLRAKWWWHRSKAG